MLNGTNAGGTVYTIEEQMRHVDKVIKECENSRKNLDHIGRRLDDLNDEVKRYRDYLGNEKSHRDPAVYKTVNAEQPSPYNERILGIMSNLTSQLTQEWSEKLRSIYYVMSSPPPSTPGSKLSERN